MVVFTCNHCGDSLQKPRVEKHYYTVCRRPKFLSCVDCLKDFRNEEYVAHTKCVTEAERYAAKGTFPGGVQQKGAVKQEGWTELVKSALNNAALNKPNQQKIVELVVASVNVPKKKTKFTNFITSALGFKINVSDIEKVWDTIEKYKASQQKSNGNLAETTQTADKIEESSNGIKEEKPTLNGELTTGKNGESAFVNGDVFTNFVKNLLKTEIISNLQDEDIIKTISNLKVVPLKKKKLKKTLIKGHGDVTADFDLIWNLIEKKQKESSEDAPVANESMDMSTAEDVKEAISWQDKLLKLSVVSEPNKKQIIEAALNLTELPTKKSKFIKIIKKAIPGVNKEDIESTWSLIQETDTIVSSSTANNVCKKRKNDEAEDNEVISKKTKLEPAVELSNGNVDNGVAINGHANESNGVEDIAEQASAPVLDKAFFKEKILETLTKRKSISLNSLEKKVFSKYRKSVGEPTPKVIAKYKKQLNKINNIEVAGDVVNLKL